MPVRTTPFPPRPPKFGPEEISAITDVLKTNVLWYWKSGSVVAAAMAKYATYFGSPYAVATSSGTASLHVALAASRLKPGTEVITTPITDVGTLNAILFQNLIPVFSDVDPDTAMPSVDHIRQAITPNTGAVIAVHLTGRPMEIDAIADLCRARGLVLIEDCAQGLGAHYKGKNIGLFGDFGCFSLNDQKHITSGEGGFILTGTEERFYLCHNYADKFYDRHDRGVRFEALAPNYRMSEIDGAMASIQLDRLKGIVDRRRELGDRLNAELAAIKGILPQTGADGGEGSYFFYLLRIDPDVIGCTREQFLAALKAEGVEARGAYVKWPMYRSPYFSNKAFFPGGVWPAEVVSGRTYDYASTRLPGAELAVATGIIINLHEGFSDADIDDCIEAIRQVADRNRRP